MRSARRQYSAVSSVSSLPVADQKHWQMDRIAAKVKANLDTGPFFAGEAVVNGWTLMVRDDGHNLARGS